jgi:hypothetical protein
MEALRDPKSVTILVSGLNWKLISSKRSFNLNYLEQDIITLLNSAESQSLYIFLFHQLIGQNLPSPPSLASALLSASPFTYVTSYHHLT